jgi:transmembrane sensor
MPTQEQLNRLLEKYATGTCTPEEIRQLKAWFQGIGSEPTEELSEANQQRMLRAFRDNPRFRKKAPTRIFALPPWHKIAVAASLVGIVLLTGLWFIRNQGPAQTATVKNDIRPGGNKAILTLADGRKVILDSVANGKIANQSGIAVTKTQAGLLTYTIISTPKISAPAKSISYNIIETPRGGQYQVILPDGSRVWLNAASSIRFPAAFTAAERKVEITGEVYFEVARNPERPFLVVSDNQTVEVLGTHFNVKAYSNDPSVITTLLEGSVKVSTKDNIHKILVPGQRAILNAGSLMVEKANIEEAVAWKNGYFRFNDEKIESVMRQLSRWYNIEVSYEGPVSDEEFNGRVSRFKNISQVLKMLEQTKGVHFKIAERKVTVMQ